MYRRHRIGRLGALTLTLALVAAACTSDEADTAAEAVTDTPTETTAEAPADEAAAGDGEPVVSMRESGMTVTVQAFETVTVHSLTAPEDVFANSTHILETANSIVLVDTQFLLPFAADVRAYADGLGKPADRMFITHEHPDHFLGGEVFADIPMYALADVAAAIEAKGQAEIDEKQADFGAEMIPDTFVVPEIVEPGTITIDGLELELIEVLDAEAPVQLVIRVPAEGVSVTGDIIYSGVHLILAGPPATWIEALELLDGYGDERFLPGHGLPVGGDEIDANIAYLSTALELLDSVDNADDFRNGLLEAYPDRGMAAAIDFAIPAYFPEG